MNTHSSEVMVETLLAASSNDVIAVWGENGPLFDTPVDSQRTFGVFTVFVVLAEITHE